MLDKIKAFIKKTSERPPFDASGFDDPLALKTHWTPLKSGGSNFRTHKLITVDYNRLEFKATPGAKIFCFIFIITGLAVPAIFAINRIQNNPLMDGDILFAIMFGFIFFGVGSFMFYKFAKPVIFDKTRGMYWKGWKAPERYLTHEMVKNGSRIAQIYAIQLISEFVRSDKNSYYSYELNLVLRDGSRMNVVDHGNATKLREDATSFSEFLGVPVWDAG